MEKLIAGLHKFQSHVVAKDREFFELLAKGQAPETLFITCSDSRINPNLLTQTAPGDLFIVRNAGNLVPPHGAISGGEAATIEYAVNVLGIKEIILCGHSHCGAMSGLINPSALEKLPAMRAWLSHTERTREILHDRYSHLEGEALLSIAIQENVLVQMENLRTLPAVADALERGQVRLHGWVYKIETGAVFAYDAEHDEFERVGGAATPSVRSKPAADI